MSPSSRFWGATQAERDAQCKYPERVYAVRIGDHDKYSTKAGVTLPEGARFFGFISSARQLPRIS